MTLEDLIKEKAEVDDKIKKLSETSNQLYREIRKLEKLEVVDFQNKCIKIGHTGVMYVTSQSLYEDNIELKGIYFYLDDKDMKRFFNESWRFLGQGHMSLNIDIDIATKIPLEEFKERTTGDKKDIYEIQYVDFEKDIDGMAEYFKGNMSIFRWINAQQTFRD